MESTSAPVLSVGVTGHRLNKLHAGDVARLTHEVRCVLGEIAGAIAGSAPAARPPNLRVVSPLAEGADRIVAAAALDHGAELVALLPFRRDIYSRDFASAASRAEFGNLLSRAAEVVELDGEADEDRDSAYERVGALVIERSDVLIALWNGEEASGAGGTAQIVELARRRRRPVLWMPTSVGNSGEAAPRLLMEDRISDTDAKEAFVAIAKSIARGQLSRA
jgi:hypothetical protein